jgi:hypothetical protein
MGYGTFRWWRRELERPSRPGVLRMHIGVWRPRLSCGSWTRRRWAGRSRWTGCGASSGSTPRCGAELRGVISTKPGLKRYLRTTPAGLLRVDKKAVDSEANLDGKFLLRCSDPKLSAEDIALGYKQLLEVERGWRDMKSIIDMRPVYHRVEQRIRAHVLLCWLALLLIRIAETTTGQT